jgi:hypothetical protein
MKKFSVMMVFAVVVCLLVLPGMAGAVDWSVEPFIKGGSVNWVEKGISEGNKFSLGGGVKLNAVSGNLSGNVTLEKEQIAEGMDEDREIPNRFYAVGGEVAYKLVTYNGVVFSPYTGVGYENWSREIQNPKICGSWDEIDFFAWSLGVRANYKQIYAGIGGILPFAIDTNHSSDLKSRLGYQAEVGASIWKGLNAALQYRSLRMGNPHSRLNTTALLVGYKIPL